MSHSVAQPIREVSMTKKSFPAGFVSCTAWYQKKTGLSSQEQTAVVLKYFSLELK